jgi:GNAT superfamily N-acetyltransferase
MSDSATRVADSGAFRIRRYGPADLETCLAVWRRGSEIAHPFLSADDLDGDEALVRVAWLPAASVRVAERDGRVAGFVALLGSHVGALFIHPALTRRGLGRALMATVPEADTVDAYAANATACAFYEALGFRARLTRPCDDLGRPHPVVCFARPVGAV